MLSGVPVSTQGLSGIPPLSMKKNKRMTGTGYFTTLGT